MSGSQTVRATAGVSPLAVQMHGQTRFSDDNPASPAQQPDGMPPLLKVPEQQTRSRFMGAPWPLSSQQTMVFGHNCQGY